MVDFEAALWLALAQELSDVVVKGCTFHFCQAVWRKVQELGLQTAYTNLRRTHSFIRYYTMFVFAYFVCRSVCLVSFIFMFTYCYFGRGFSSAVLSVFVVCTCACEPDMEPGHIFWPSDPAKPPTRRPSWPTDPDRDSYYIIRTSIASHRCSIVNDLEWPLTPFQGHDIFEVEYRNDGAS